MTVTVDLVRQEAADLHRFIEPIIRACSDLRQDYPVFAKASRDFFSYIQALGLQTQDFLERFPEAYAKTSVPAVALSKRQKLKTLHSAWESLHEYIKPALDADSLNLPTPLIAAFEDMVHEVKAWKKFEFVLFHTNEANYLQVPAERAKDVANRIADEVGGERFSPYLGLVGIPYSQAKSFFLNCLLPHEFAHFIYQEAASYDIIPMIDAAMEVLDKEVGPLNYRIVSYRKDTLERWMEETFCDLLALCLIGPAFTFAFCELTTASALLGRSEGELTEFYEFNSFYPAESARLHIHLETLKHIGWWPQIEKHKSAPVQVLRTCEKWSKKFFVTIPVDDDDHISDARFLSAYQDLASWMIKYVTKLVGSASKSDKAYSEQSVVITEYLRRAVVPSTIIVKGRKVHPSPQVIINAGYCFMLEAMTQLVDNVHKMNPDSVKDRSTLTQRLELWLLKALEDNRLLTRQVMTNVSSPQR